MRDLYALSDRDLAIASFMTRLGIEGMYEELQEDAERRARKKAEKLAEEQARADAEAAAETARRAAWEAKPILRVRQQDRGVDTFLAVLLDDVRIEVID
ncbi:hypothetical protein [Jiella sp. M17.18]|uniref:hypothetical protein n=1 Tax=Jiella sp. M17.18 TaxID=3234247 RepID=UPI0034DF47E4